MHLSASSLRRVLTALCVSCLLTAGASAQSPFQDLLGRVPRTANAVTILNVEKAKQSPSGKAEGVAEKIEKAFSDGTIRVPPSALRFLLASELDLEFLSPVWEAAVMDLSEAPSMNLIAKAYHGEPDTIDGMPAVALPQDVYVLKLGQNTLGAMSPANRQAVVRWAKETKSASSHLSPYLEKAAGYSDRAGTEIIMAMDLEGAIAPQRLDAYLKSVDWLKDAKVDAAKLKQLLSSVEGVRLGVRLGNPPNGKVTIDFHETASLSPASAKRLFLEFLAAKGVLIDDFEQWQPEVQGTTISLAGKMSMPGIRKLMSVIESPAPTAGSVEAASDTSAGTSTAAAAKTKAYFKSVTDIFDDLKQDMRDAKNISSTSLFFDKYARRIERLPMLDVDPQMLDYGAFVAAQLRQSSGSVRTMGIRGGVRTAEITSGSTSSDYYYGGYGYGRYGGVTGIKQDIAAQEEQRGVVRAQEKGIAAASVQDIKAGVIAATSDIRRKMTEKYRIEF